MSCSCPVYSSLTSSVLTPIRFWNMAARSELFSLRLGFGGVLQLGFGDPSFPLACKIQLVLLPFPTLSPKGLPAGVSARWLTQGSSKALLGAAAPQGPLPAPPT